MSKHTAPPNLSTRLREYDAKVAHIITGNDFPGNGRRRAESPEASA